MAVYLALQNSVCEANGKQDKTVAIQKCGNLPYEISLRFAGCILRCGACFASGYSWPDWYSQSTRVKRNIPLDCLIKDYKAIPREGKPYNWMRILGGVPLQNEEYINYLFAFLKSIVRLDTAIFRCGIIIQTNGIFVGTQRSVLLKRHLDELYNINPQLRIAIEISIKVLLHIGETKTRFSKRCQCTELKTNSTTCWVRYSLKQAKEVFGQRFYDSQFSTRNPIVEQRVKELLGIFSYLTTKITIVDLLNSRLHNNGCSRPRYARRLNPTVSLITRRPSQ